VDRSMRIRFTSPHPKDFPDKLLQVIADNCNVCRRCVSVAFFFSRSNACVLSIIAGSIHLPAQSGSSSVLARMRRGYKRFLPKSKTVCLLNSHAFHRRYTADAYRDLVRHIRSTVSSCFSCRVLN
jgi:tRNA A37 methylthiotransferase MiaB